MAQIPDTDGVAQIPSSRKCFLDEIPSSVNEKINIFSMTVFTASLQTFLDDSSEAVNTVIEKTFLDDGLQTLKSEDRYRQNASRRCSALNFTHRHRVGVGTQSQACACLLACLLASVSVWGRAAFPHSSVHTRHVACSRCTERTRAAIDLSCDAPQHVGLTPAIACL